MGGKTSHSIPRTDISLTMRVTACQPKNFQNWGKQRTKCKDGSTAFVRAGSTQILERGRNRLEKHCAWVDY